jgi:site-specific recombinase XerD
MKWPYWISLYVQTHCTARGLRSTTLSAYQTILEQFREWMGSCRGDVSPDALETRDILAYVEHLRRERRNGESAVSRHVVVIRGFYRAMVAMGQLEAGSNPMAWFPKVKGPRRKLPVVLSEREVRRLLATPEGDSVLGLRDRALLQILYGTGIRASECASLREQDVDLAEKTVRVCGKGGHERTLPLNDAVVETLAAYRNARGPAAREAPFFVSRLRRAMTRGTVYERVRTLARRARLPQRLSPHRLRHTFATHLMRAGVGLVTLRDLLGHRQLTSTQLYLHVTAQELRDAADRHPIGRLVDTVAAWWPGVRLPLQHVRPPGRPRLA